MANPRQMWFIIQHLIIYKTRRAREQMQPSYWLFSRCAREIQASHWPPRAHRAISPPDNVDAFWNFELKYHNLFQQQFKLYDAIPIQILVKYKGINFNFSKLEKSKLCQDFQICKYIFPPPFVRSLILD